MPLIIYTPPVRKKKRVMDDVLLDNQDVPAAN